MEVASASAVEVGGFCLTVTLASTSVLHSTVSVLGKDAAGAECEVGGRVNSCQGIG